MRAYQVEVYRVADGQWVAFGPPCFDDMEALQNLDHTPVPGALKRLSQVDVSAAMEKEEGGLPDGLDRRRIDFARYLLITGRLGEGPSSLGPGHAARTVHSAPGGTVCPC